MRFPRFSRRAPAPRSAFAWRWLYPLVLVGFIAGAVLLADSGVRNALNIKSGKVTRVQSDPTQPGFLAEVVPTATMLVIETGASNEAIGLTAMSLGADNKGGWVLQIPVETRMKDGKLLWQIWEDAALTPPETNAPTSVPSSAPTTVAPTTSRQAAQASSTTTTLVAPNEAAGKAAMAQAVGQLLGFAFPTDVIVLPTKTLATLMTPAMPITYTLQGPVQTTGPKPGSLETKFGAGTIKIQKADDVVVLAETVGPGESPQTRVKRQIDLWNAWITTLTATPASVDAIKSDSTALVTYLKALVVGPTLYRQLPVANEGRFAGFWILEPDTTNTAALSTQMVPFPLMVTPGARLRTALFNGTTNRDLTLTAATRLVENGAQIDVLGNAGTFDVAQSEVVYYDTDLKTRVESFGRSLGIDTVRLVPGDSAVDVTVTLGADFKG